MSETVVIRVSSKQKRAALFQLLDGEIQKVWDAFGAAESAGVNFNLEKSKPLLRKIAATVDWFDNPDIYPVWIGTFRNVAAVANGLHESAALLGRYHRHSVGLDYRHGGGHDFAWAIMWWVSRRFGKGVVYSSHNSGEALPESQIDRNPAKEHVWEWCDRYLLPRARALGLRVK